MTTRAREGSDGADHGTELAAQIGSVSLRSCVLTASGTAGHSDELSAYVDLGTIGAVVTKSLSADSWPGNPAPRIHQTPAGMINSVGLQGPGVEAWLRHDLPPLLATGAVVVASIWGRSVDDYAAAARALADAPAGVVAVEVNLSCPNLDGGRHLFAQDPDLTASAVEAAAAGGRPVWAKLTPAVTDLVPIVDAAIGAGAEAITLINTALGMVIDVESRRPLLGGGGGGLSGPAIHPLAVRAVFDVHAARPTVPIIGAGGVARGVDAVELLLAGAAAVQVGTATFANPRAVAVVQAEIDAWCAAHGVATVTELTGGAHAR